jgi:hypothetical protein
VTDGHSRSLAQRRLIAVCRADPLGRYEWLPPSRPGDVVIALDGMAHADLVERRPLLFDELESWDIRSAAEHRIVELMSAIRSHPAVSAIERDGHRLIEFAALRLREELARMLRGWELARAGAGAGELVCDPGAAPALVMGIRVGLGIGFAATPYQLPPALPGSRRKRALARPLMRALAAGSRPERVRIAVVVAGKLALALDALSADELGALRVGTAPFPGLDHGNGALLALRRRLDLLGSYGSPRRDAGPAVSLPDRLGLDEAPGLDRAIALLTGRVLTSAAPELAEAVDALGGLEQAHSLRALVLPSAAYGASRLLIEWAHERGVQVAAMQHGIYSFKEFDGGDRLADVIFGWGAGTAEQISCWPDPRPAMLAVGVPGTVSSPVRPPSAGVSRALVATSNTVDTPLAPAAFCEAFIDTVTPGLRRLQAAGVELELRPHPNEDPERYRRLLRMRGLDAQVVAGGALSAAVAGTDILVSSASSVAFEAAALGVPVLLWTGGAPQRVRREHLVAPWAESGPGMFEQADGFASLADGLLEEPAQTLRVAHALACRLARYAQPFDPACFANGLHALAA